MRRSESKQDKYTQFAKEAGYPARSVYKLKELDRRYHLFARGDRVLDLGSSPGSWMLYIAKRVGKEGSLVGVDTLPLSVKLPENASFLQKDICDASLKSELEGPFNAIVSDAAPKTSGMRDRDATLSLHLAECALDIALSVGAKDSWFVCKIFESAAAQEWYKRLKRRSQDATSFRSRASPRGSRELYVVARRLS